MTRIDEAREVLGDLGFDAERCNERSALVLLALLGMGPTTPWAQATNNMYRTAALMEWIRDQHDKKYAPNTRETVRRFTLHQFADEGMVEQNADQPDRPVNSPKWNYRVSPAALTVFQSVGDAGYHERLRSYLEAAPGQVSRYAAAREMQRLPVTLSDGRTVSLSPGGQNVLIKQMVDDFCSRYTPGGRVIYVGDADAKFAEFDEEALRSLGVTVDQHGKMPDLIVHLEDRGWLVLLEAASSHGPVDAKRHGELARLFMNSTAGLVYVSCFPSRAEMRKYLSVIAWETEVWCADAPDHLIHFNGERFLGPYDAQR